MDDFTLLKYWRSSAGGSTTTISAADSTSFVRADTGSPYSSDGEDGPYFDLEFALSEQESDADDVPREKSRQNDQISIETDDEDEIESESEAEEISVNENEENDDGEVEDEGELNFSVASNDCADQATAALSPPDELFFKGNLVSIEPSSIIVSGSCEESSKLPVFLVKSATKFRVLLLKLKKSKSSNGENVERPERAENNSERENQGKMSGKLMAVKFKVEEGPLMSLFTGDNSAKENDHGGRGLKNNAEANHVDERKLNKEVVLQKYLKMVKLRVSKSYVEKLKLAGGKLTSGGGSKSSSAAAAGRGDAKPREKQGTGSNNLQAGLKVVRKHLRKSQPASAARGGSLEPPRRLGGEQLDGIQGAILHCKRSFNA